MYRLNEMKENIKVVMDFRHSDKVQNAMQGKPQWVTTKTETHLIILFSSVSFADSKNKQDLIALMISFFIQRD